MAKALERIVEARGRLRVAAVGLAVERYRVGPQRKLPRRLSELDPEWIGTLPTDPFNERPLRYKRLRGGGYVVYSTGLDLQDNDGRVRSPKASDARNFDVTFTVAK